MTGKAAAEWWVVTGLGHYELLRVYSGAPLLLSGSRLQLRVCLAQAVSLYQCWTEHEQSAVAGTGPAEAATNKAVYNVLGVQYTPPPHNRWRKY